jgi:hypothetical protein
VLALKFYCPLLIQLAVMPISKNKTKGKKHHPSRHGWEWRIHHLHWGEGGEDKDVRYTLNKNFKFLELENHCRLVVQPGNDTYHWQVV